ncbi:MAG: HAD family hydrolase [Thermoprotei archaeon]
MIKLISFDVWGTLLNLHIFYNEVAKEFSLLTKNDNVSTLNIIENAYDKAKNLRRAGKFSEHNIYEESSKFLASKLNSSPNIVKRAFHRAALTVNVDELVMDDARNVLEEIRKLDIKIVTLGNTLFWPSSITRILLERTQLTNYIDDEFYSDEIGFFKPKFEAFNTMLTTMNVPASQALHVGDSLHEDFIGSINSGLRGVLIDPSVSGIIKVSKYGFIIPQLKYVLKLIYDV